VVQLFDIKESKYPSLDNDYRIDEVEGEEGGFEEGRIIIHLKKEWCWPPPYSSKSDPLRSKSFASYRDAKAMLRRVIHIDDLK